MQNYGEIFEYKNKTIDSKVTWNYLWIKKTVKDINVGESIDKSQITKDFNHAKHALDGATQEVTHEKTATVFITRNRTSKIREKILIEDELALEKLLVLNLKNY